MNRFAFKTREMAPRKKQKTENLDSLDNRLLDLPNELHGLISTYYQYKPPSFEWRIFWKRRCDANARWEFGVDLEQDHGFYVFVPFRAEYSRMHPINRHLIYDGGSDMEHRDSMYMQIESCGIWLEHLDEEGEDDPQRPYFHIPKSHPQFAEFRQELLDSLKDLQESIWEEFPDIKVMHVLHYSPSDWE